MVEGCLGREDRLVLQVGVIDCFKSDTTWSGKIMVQQGVIFRVSDTSREVGKVDTVSKI